MARFYSFHVTDKNERKEKKKAFTLPSFWMLCINNYVSISTRFVFVFSYFIKGWCGRPLALACWTVQWIVLTLIWVLCKNRMYRKLQYVNRVEFLWNHVRRNEIEFEIPEFVFDQDEELEHRTMMEYGLESDHRRAYGTPSVDSAVSMYSMRCIAWSMQWMVFVLNKGVCCE